MHNIMHGHDLMPDIYSAIKTGPGTCIRLTGTSYKVPVKQALVNEQPQSPSGLNRVHGLVWINSRHYLTLAVILTSTSSYLITKFR
jgi:hypothetical protein